MTGERRSDRPERRRSVWRVTALAGVAVVLGVVAFGVRSAVSYFGDGCTERDKTVIAEIPQYPGATLEWRRPLPAWGPRWCRAYLTSGDPASVVWQFYGSGLRQRGWRVIPLGADGSGVYAQRLVSAGVWELSISDFGDRFYLVIPDDATPNSNFGSGSTEP